MFALIYLIATVSTVVLLFIGSELRCPVPQLLFSAKPRRGRHVGLVCPVVVLRANRNQMGNQKQPRNTKYKHRRPAANYEWEGGEG